MNGKLNIVCLDFESTQKILESLNEMFDVFSRIAIHSHPQISKFLIAKDRIHELLSNGVIREELSEPVPNRQDLSMRGYWDLHKANQWKV